MFIHSIYLFFSFISPFIYRFIHSFILNIVIHRFWFWFFCLLIHVSVCLPVFLYVPTHRSSLDEYCPPDQVYFIQSNMLKVLETLFGSLDVHKEYGEASGESALQSS